MISPATKSTLKVKNMIIEKAIKASANMSYLAAYLRYFGVLFFGKGHLDAQVPSKASVNSPMIKIKKPVAISIRVKLSIKSMIAKIILEKVRISAKYLMITF